MLRRLGRQSKRGASPSSAMLLIRNRLGMVASARWAGDASPLPLLTVKFEGIKVAPAPWAVAGADRVAWMGGGDDLVPVAVPATPVTACEGPSAVAVAIVAVAIVVVADADADGDADADAVDAAEPVPKPEFALPASPLAGESSTPLLTDTRVAPNASSRSTSSVWARRGGGCGCMEEDGCDPVSASACV